MFGRIAILFLCGVTLLGGCAKSDSGSPLPIRLTLDWKPEPEFGGFYGAQQAGAFSKHALNVKIQPAGEGADTWQLVATGRTEFTAKLVQTRAQHRSFGPTKPQVCLMER